MFPAIPDPRHANESKWTSTPGAASPVLFARGVSEANERVGSQRVVG
jgi:hypothetical protein